MLESVPNLDLPDEVIPLGDETRRLHRWGYRQYREMFNDRQLLGLGLLRKRIHEVADGPVRQALLTVFSDCLRYQNMLCRYDTYALKCQDIFSVHGFPVGLVQCENNLLGIPGVGSGGFRHFVEKYRRAKAYCTTPFETRQRGRKKEQITIQGESIQAELVVDTPSGSVRQAQLICGPAAEVSLPPNSLDGVFTDPPYFDNVQYAELMDFCYVWLRQSLEVEFREFSPSTTRNQHELTGNATLGRDLEHFTEGLSRVFCQFSAALKPDAAFVFTYHHNQIEAYAPVVVGLLDAGLYCTEVLPAPAEMGASLHINNTESSILDSVFVARRVGPGVLVLPTREEFMRRVLDNCGEVATGGVTVTRGDARCLCSGHLARVCVQFLRVGWEPLRPVCHRLERVRTAFRTLSACYNLGEVIERAVDPRIPEQEAQMRLFEKGPAGAASV